MAYQRANIIKSNQPAHETVTRILIFYVNYANYNPLVPLTCASFYFPHPGFLNRILPRNFSGGSDDSYAPAGSFSPSSVAG